MRFAGDIPYDYTQQYAAGFNPSKFDTSALPQQYGDVAGLNLGPILKLGSRLGSASTAANVAERENTGLGGMLAAYGADRLAQNLGTYLGGAAKNLGMVGAGLGGEVVGGALGGVAADMINPQAAGGPLDTLKGNPYYQQYQRR